MKKHIKKVRKKIKSWEKHRNITWTVAIAFFVTFAILGYINVTNENFDREVVGSNSEFGAWKNYTNKTFGFSLRYPNDWVLESPASNIIIFESSDSTFEQVTVSVLGAGDEEAIREALNIVSEDRVPIHEIDGPRIVNLLSNGNLETVVLARPDFRLFVIRGTSRVIDDIVSTLKFLAQENE
jgi:hypothetical protein